MLHAPRAQLLESLCGHRRLVDAIRSAASNPPSDDLAWLQQAPRRHAVFLDQPGYPSRLAQIANPPPALLMQGEASLLDAPQIAIVGSRNATPAGRDIAYELAAALAEAGLSVTSGLAEGIDAAAHRGALAGGGGTTAVLGTGPDRVYPRQHKDLAHAVCANGLLISEQPVGTPPRGFNFPRRNRIISGLSLGVLVVEAGPRSGSLITARLAADQGREVFAVPGGIHNPLARGCHQLIRQGAKLVETAQDIIDELGPLAAVTLQADATAQADNGDSWQPDAEYLQLLEFMGFDNVSIDRLVERCGLTPAAVSSMLLQLELSGHIASSPGGYYNRLK